jgi:hypothetical protein
MVVITRHSATVTSSFEPHTMLQDLLEAARARGTCVELDWQTRLGHTALMLACIKEREQCALVLLEQKPPPRLDLQDNKGWTCLDHAEAKKLGDILQILLRMGAVRGLAPSP